MKIAIVGNGSIALHIAWRLTDRFPDASIAIVAPRARPGCASLAAAAMFNSFCEVDDGMLDNAAEREKFALNRAAAPLWPRVLERLRAESAMPVNAGFGTFLINNATSDSLEDRNYDAIRSALVAYGEPFEDVDPAIITNYSPAAHSRALRALYIPAEGWVNPRHLVDALESILQHSPRVTFVDDLAAGVSYDAARGRVDGVRTANGTRVDGDAVILAPGASFSAIVAGSRLPIDFQRIFFGAGTSMRIRTGDATLLNCVRTPNRGLACGTYAAPQDPAHTLVGASNFISPEPVAAPRLTSIYGLLEGAMEQINQTWYRAELDTINFGWRPTSTDTLPLLGRCAIPNLLVATGTKRDGLHCSPLIAEIFADLLDEREPSLDLSAFRPDRPVQRIMSRAESVHKLVEHTMNAAFQHGYHPARNRMNDDLRAHYTSVFERLHDDVGAHDWGIPPEMKDMYKYGHAKAPAVAVPA